MTYKAIDVLMKLDGYKLFKGDIPGQCRECGSKKEDLIIMRTNNYLNYYIYVCKPCRPKIENRAYKVWEGN